MMRSVQWSRVFAVVGVVASVGMSVAAITVTITRTPDAVSTTSTPAMPVGASSGPVGGPADKALCTALVPLVDEEARLSTDLAARGRETSPAFGDAVPDYKAAVSSWAGRIESVLDSHPDASGYLIRGLHRYVDAGQIYASMLAPGESTGVAGGTAWTESNVGLGAARDVCGGVGVEL